MGSGSSKSTEVASSSTSSGAPARVSSYALSPSVDAFASTKDGAPGRDGAVEAAAGRDVGLGWFVRDGQVVLVDAKSKAEKERFEKSAKGLKLLDTRFHSEMNGFAPGARLLFPSLGDDQRDAEILNGRALMDDAESPLYNTFARGLNNGTAPYDPVKRILLGGGLVGGLIGFPVGFVWARLKEDTPKGTTALRFAAAGAALGLAETSVAGAISYARGTDGHKLDHFLAGAIVGGAVGLISLRRQPTKTYNGGYVIAFSTLGSLVSLAVVYPSRNPWA